MGKQVIANREQETTMATDKLLTMPQGLVKRMKNAISTNIGLYEIRMNLFLWGLFRIGRQKEN